MNFKLNQLLFDEYYCQFSVDLLKDLEPIYLNHSEKIRNRDADSIRALFEALFYSSVAMTITGTSAPASGGEHLISHTLDMLADISGTKKLSDNIPIIESICSLIIDILIKDGLTDSASDFLLDHAPVIQQKIENEYLRNMVPWG